ncbi:hypothetical protein [Hominifimenecus sp. rT4P-3]|uniref:hypothetical protein n=1 Tax=Hominifimenecus sp. rT4P-3 TaxID=3242979 RepID=UPI003DA3D959
MKPELEAWGQEKEDDRNVELKQVSRKSKGKMLLIYFLVGALLISCLILPEYALRVWGETDMEIVQEADRAYYSRQMAAYTGELDIYRKLLMIWGIWKSEKTPAQQDILDEREASIKAAQENRSKTGEWAENWEFSTYFFEEVFQFLLTRINEPLIGLGQYWYMDSGLTVEIYEYQDAVLGKYRFYVGEAAIRVLESETGKSALLSMVYDLDTNTILAVRIGNEIKEAFWNASGLELIAEYLYSNSELYAEGFENISKALRVRNQPVEGVGFWEQQDGFEVYEQYEYPWNGNSGREQIVFVVQDNSEGFEMFLYPEAEE